MRLPEERRGRGWTSTLRQPLDCDYGNENYRETDEKMMEAHAAMLWRLRAAGEDKNIFASNFLSAPNFARSPTLFVVAAVVGRGFFNSQVSPFPSEKSDDHSDRIDKSVRQHRGPKVSPG